MPERRETTPPRGTAPCPPSSGELQPAVGFGYKCQWLAVEATDPEALARALGVAEPRRADWGPGLEWMYEGRASEVRVFLTPPLGAWVLAAGTFLNDLWRADEQALVPFLESLSARLETRVQYFGTHRIVEYQGWALADRGRVERAYVYLGESGEVLLDFGERTAEEQERGIATTAELEAMGDEAFDDLDAAPWPDEEDVMRFADAWSLDPTTLEERFERVEPGWVGTATAR